jgi:hypothetical protein
MKAIAAGVVIAVEQAAFQPQSESLDAIVRLDDGRTIRLPANGARLGDHVEIIETQTTGAEQ